MFKKEATLLYFLFFISSKAMLSQTFLDVAALQNFNYTSINTDAYGSGVSFFDFDNDGWDDIMMANKDDSLFLYKNNLGQLQKISTNIYVSGGVKHPIWVDYDNDGNNDLFITVRGGRCRLYHNNGNYNFTDVTIPAGIAFTLGPNYGVSFADFNKDGYLDFYVCRYSSPPSAVGVDSLNALFKNNGNGTFTNIANLAGVEDGNKPSFLGTWLDYNKDGWPDLYVINDKVQFNSSLYRNNGDETFTDVSAQSGTIDTLADPMTNTVGDFDEDGDLDIFMSNSLYLDSCRILVNNNDGTFTNQTSAYGINNGEFTWGATWFDAENDSDLDLFLASDINTLDPRNYLYLNTGASYFVESPQSFQSNNIASSQSVACGDLNNDGKADIVVSNSAGYNSFLWKNTSQNNNNFIKITLSGVVSNKMAIGSWISVYSGNHVYSKYTFCGENYLGQNSQHHIFGLNNNLIVDSIVVLYLSGITDRYYNLAVNDHYYFTEGETYNNNIIYNAPLSFCEGDSIILNAGQYNSYFWSNGATTQYLTVSQSGSYWVDVVNQLGSMVPSDTLTVQIENQPQISINAQDISCFGLNDGSIILDIVNQTNNFSIQWNQGLQGDTLNNLAAGNYVYEYNDIYGCTYSDSINIYNPFALNVLSQITPYTLSAYGAIYSIINGGTAPYEIYLDSLLQGTIIDSLLPGFYYYEVYDANGCNYTSTIEIIDETLISIFNEKTGAIKFQNPMAGDYLFKNCFRSKGESF